tara:strand:- start:7099 stop:8034 length:936 start_codon:yes stop_codon:yes gene_type:complete
MYSKISWPENKSFAFTIFDDTDRANLEDNKLVYELLYNLGLKTTKSVWVSKGDKSDNNDGGITCDDKDYLNWLLNLKKKGFEIGYHNTTYQSAYRKEIEEGLKKFVSTFGKSPIVMANHSVNKENIYWGPSRLTGSRKMIYNILTLFRNNNFYEGQNESSPYFWGDLCKEYVTYVRNFVFSDINTLKCCPYMPYQDLTKPYVNYWYASTEGNNVNKFNKCISDKNLDKLESEGGACIMYTHFADGFCKDGKLSEKFKKQIERLSKKNGWFVPVSTLLDFLKKKNKTKIISDNERRNLEWKWLLNKLILGST